MQRQRGQRVNAPEAPQPGDRRPPLLIQRQAREPLSDRCLARRQSIRRGDQVGEHDLAGSLLEALTREPAPMLNCPRRGPRIDPAMTEQHLGDPVASRHQISPAGIVRAHQLTRRLDLHRRHDDRGQRASQQQPREQLGVLAISLDPVRGTPRCLARRDHLHLDASSHRSAIEAESRWSCLIASAHRSTQPTQPRNRLLDPRPEPHTQHLASLNIDGRRMRRAGMDIKTCTRHYSGHGRTSSLIWGQPEPVSGQTNPREERPAYLPRRSTPTGDHAIGSRCSS